MIVSLAVLVTSLYATCLGISLVCSNVELEFLSQDFTIVVPSYVTDTRVPNTVLLAIEEKVLAKKFKTWDLQ